MSTFDWCKRGQHDKCLDEYQRFYIGPVGRGRNKKDGVIFLDEIAQCDCKCHKRETITDTELI